MRLFKDPLHIRVLSGCFFAAAFVWVAVKFFNVDTEVVWVLAWMSVIMVAAMIVLALAGSVVLRLLRFRRSPGLLDSLSELDKGSANKPDDNPSVAEKPAEDAGFETIPEGKKDSPPR